MPKYESMKQLYLEYFGAEVIENVDWVPEKVCRTCNGSLTKWSQNKRKSMQFGVPMLWYNPGNFTAVQNMYYIKYINFISQVYTLNHSVICV